MLVAAVYCHFDFTHHTNGHELSVSVKDEAKKIWVIFMESNDPANKKTVDTNREVKAAIKQKLVNEDAYYTEVDFTQEKTKTDYKEFTDLIDFKDKAFDYLKEGPVVALVHNKKGCWIYGHGIPSETVDIIHAFILQKEAGKNKSEAISVGGASTHPSASGSFGGGY
eukprot:CAMPEP_0168320454 /NCGR_PEP_ID=MMETSP0213-20121227/1677_1 /TAXON_ID=151035 /ORGANISM="Euplotes harpa, Strain FSP1.4" /LENGTH=166 /DNA_ID=CAMNT_0008321901 /DNA_START=31 /DNA_END=531 /DNA_ORIENTATION=-